MSAARAQIRDMEMRRQQAMAAHPSLSSSMHNQDGSDSKAASQLPREDDAGAFRTRRCRRLAARRAM